MEATNKPTLALFTALLYTAVIGAGMYVVHHRYGSSYGEPEMVNVLWAVEIILTLIAIFAVQRYFGWSKIGFDRLQWQQVWWLLPMFVVLGALWLQFFVLLSDVSFTAKQWRLFALIGFTTLLVGFSEEVVYRGIVLHAFLSQSHVWVAMLVSAIAFSLLHSVNVFGGMPPFGMAVQLVMTGLVGFLLAPLALKLENLWPLIIWHWLWDFVLFAGAMIGMDISLSFFMIAIEVVLGIILWVLVGRATRKNPQPPFAAPTGRA